MGALPAPARGPRGTLHHPRPDDEGRRAGSVRSAAFRAIAVGTGTSTAGSVLNSVAVFTYVFAVTGEAVPLGVAVIANLLPMAVLMPVISRWVPPGHERAVVLITIVLQAVGAGVMAGVALTDAVPAMYALVAVMGVLAILTRVSLLCLLPLVVSRGELTAANLRFQIASQIGATAGSSVLIIAGTTAPWVLFVMDAASYVIQTAILVRTLPRRADTAPVEGEEHAAAGSHVLSKGRWVQLLVFLPAGFVGMQLMNAVVPLIALAKLHGGQSWLAEADLVYPVVAVTVGWLLRRKARLRIASSMLFLTAGFCVLAAADRLSLLLVGVGIIGAGVVLSNATAQVWAQAVLPREVLHRWQSRAIAAGGAVTSGGVLAVSYAFAGGYQAAALGIVAAAFLAGAVAAATTADRSL